MNLTGFEARATGLMSACGLRVGGPDGWSFKWDRAKTRAGQCNPKTRTISMSRPLAETWAESEVLETLLHEIAHALVGPKAAAHGAEWKRMAVRVGARPERCAPVSDDSPAIDGRWRGVCPAGHVLTRHKRTPKMGRISCALCAPYYDDRNRFTWTDTQAPAAVFDFTPRKPAPAQPKRAVTFTW